MKLAIPQLLAAGIALASAVSGPNSAIFKSTGIALLLAILPAVVVADPDDLYTQVGTDPTPAELIADGKIVLGESFTNRAIPGSEILPCL